MGLAMQLAGTPRRGGIALKAQQGIEPEQAATVAALVALLPDVESLSMEVVEMPRETFVNRSQYLQEAGLSA